MLPLVADAPAGQLTDVEFTVVALVTTATLALVADVVKALTRAAMLTGVGLAQLHCSLAPGDNNHKINKSLQNVLSDKWPCVVSGSSYQKCTACRGRGLLLRWVLSFCLTLYKIRYLFVGWAEVFQSECSFNLRVTASRELSFIVMTMAKNKIHLNANLCGLKPLVWSPTH